MSGYLKQLFERDDFQRYRTGAHRRRFSLMQGAITLSLIALAPAIITKAMAGDLSGFWTLVGGLGVLLVAFVYATGFLNLSIAGITEIPTRDLDEMQLRLRDEAMRTAYRILGVVLILCLGAPIVWPGATLSRTAVLSAALGVFLVYLAIPAHILAWRMPEDEDAGERVSAPAH